MRFADPLVLLLLAVPLGYALLAWLRRRRVPREHIGFPGLGFMPDLPPSRRARWRPLLPALRMGGLALLVIALARPQLPHDVREIRLRSRNIMVALDISSSMKAGDFQPGNRLEVARRVLKEFVQEREGDLIGLVIFAARTFLQAPLTPDTDLLGETIERVDIGMLPDGTAIGTALAMSLNQLKDLPPKASVIVLITDGANNTGKPSPFAAAEAARSLGVRIHSIGLSTADTTAADRNLIWRWGRAPARLTRSDEAVLTRISSRTGGQFYRATDPEALRRIVGEIDPLERQEVVVRETRDYRELYAFVLVPALVLLALEIGLGAAGLRSLP
ncbi:MAG TPA: VWA domain-containing protein [Gemmatimonadales bacterium]|nr:VWA domain-containing protein [Gemmatimonadales bacterium]